MILVRAGHEVTVAVDGEAAWTAFAETRPDVVLSDWMMPGLDGPGLVRRIRADEGPYAYVVLLTALDDPSALRGAMTAGADDYLVKPVDFAQLDARLILAERVVGLHARLAAREEELERVNATLATEARRDPLTGLGNRLRLREDLDALDARAGRYGHGYALALLDLDRFKAYNDRFGHQAGDEALRAVAAVVARQLRQGDVAYRYGGEELVVVLPAQEDDGAAVAMRRITAAVSALGLAHPDNVQAGVVTLSAGVAVRRAGEGDGAGAALRRADTALYAAKAEGRNRLVVDPAAARGDRRTAPRR